MATFGIGDVVTGPYGSGPVTKIQSGDPLIDTDDDGFGEQWISASNVEAINGEAVGQAALEAGQTVSSSGFNIQYRPENKDTNQYVVMLNGETIGRYDTLDYAQGVTESHDPEDDFGAILEGAETPVQGATDAWRASVVGGGSDGDMSTTGAMSGVGGLTGLLIAAGVGAAVLLFGGDD